MTRLPYRSWLFAVTLLSFLASSPMTAVGPSYVMFYGGQLDAPVVQKLAMGPGSEFLWSPYRAGGAIPHGLEGRPYVKYAIFWGRWKEQPSTPKGASEHGRLYLPTPSEPGVVVLTEAVMDDGSPDHPTARPIPVDLNGFKFGWAIGAQDVATAKRLGVPGL
jgi:hypothetical protein